MRFIRQILPRVGTLLLKQPLMGLPIFIALASGWLIDVVLRPSSSVAAGDSGEILLGRVIASILLVVIPSIIWALALTVTTALARDAWRGEILDFKSIGVLIRIIAMRSTMFIGILAGLQLVLAILEPFASVLAQILITGVVFCCAFALPAHIVGRLSPVAAFQTSMRTALDRPQYVAFALAVPAGVVLIGWLLSFLITNIALLGPLCGAVIAAAVITFSLLYIVVMYDRSQQFEDGIGPQEVLALPGTVDIAD